MDIIIANGLGQTLGNFALLQLMLFPLAFRFLYPINVQETSTVAIETAGMDIFPSEQVQKGVFVFNE